MQIRFSQFCRKQEEEGEEEEEEEEEGGPPPAANFVPSDIHKMSLPLSAMQSLHHPCFFTPLLMIRIVLTSS